MEWALLEVVVAAIKPTLAALTAAALALPGIIPEAEAATSAEYLQSSFQYSHYQENQSRVHVDIFHGAVLVPWGERFELGGNWVEDTWGGATPVLSVPASTPMVKSGASPVAIANAHKPIANPQPVQIMSSASIHETRRQQDFHASYHFDTVSVKLAGGQSNEPDLNSDFYNGEVSWNLNQKMTTLTAGLGLVVDEIHPVTRPIHEHKTDWALQLGATQVIDKQSLIQLGGSYTDATGFLSNAYKKVFIQDVGVIYDSRPGHRQQGAFNIRYLRHMGFADAALQLDYRLYADDWGILSHTLEAAWRQPLGEGWLLTPRLRYYSQDAADFYAPYFLGPNNSGHYSSDFRLSGYGSLSGGLSLRKKWFNRLSVDVGFEYYTHQGSLKLGGNGEGSYANVDFMLANAALSFEF